MLQVVLVVAHTHHLEGWIVLDFCDEINLFAQLSFLVHTFGCRAHAVPGLIEIRLCPQLLIWWQRDIVDFDAGVV